MDNLIQQEGGWQIHRGWLLELPACRADACQQGKQQCPCPEACMQPEPDEPRSVLASRPVWIGCGLSILAWSALCWVLL